MLSGFILVLDDTMSLVVCSMNSEDNPQEYLFQMPMIVLVSTLIAIVTSVVSIFLVRQNRHIGKKNHELELMVSELSDRLEMMEGGSVASGEDDEDLLPLFLEIDRRIKEEKLYSDVNLQRQDIIDLFCIRRNTLNHILNAHAGGLSFPAYVNTIRLERACALLCDEPDKMIKTIAEEVGLTQHNINKLFKEHFGQTPQEYRMTHLGDGLYELKIEGNTFRIYQSGVGTTQEVEFIYRAVDNSVNTNGIGTDNFTAVWTANVNPSFADPTIRVTEYNPATGKGKLQFTLGSIINDALQSGKIKLTDRNSGLSRFINVYTIDHFQFGDVSLTKTGGSRTISGKACPTYKLSFVLPKEFPVDLFPMAVRMASTTLNPFQMEMNGSPLESTTFGVEMASTENGAEIDGTTLGGMNYATTGNPWNYRAVGSPWNYWYTYTIITKPSEQDNVTYTIYFDDTRPLRAANNQASNVGLFFWIKYFGDAQSVYSN